MVDVSCDIAPLAGSLGAEVRNVDLARPLSPPTVADLRGALLEHLVLFFRNQSLDPGQQVAFARQFGEVTPAHPMVSGLEGHPEVLVLDGSDHRSNHWHTDTTFSLEPPAATLLHAKVVPAFGGDTMWANLRASYESLSEPIRCLVDRLRAVHDSRKAAEHYAASGQQPRTNGREPPPPAEHPVVRTHPETGRRSLFVNPGFTTHIVGMSRSESSHVLALLFEHSLRPQNVVRWRWAAGDVAVWDNRATMHYAIDDYGTAERRMHRVTLRGDRPR